MINSKEFAARLEEILAFYDLSASAFARAIGIQPSGISHLISGRNKPSLDFVMKVNSAYKEVSLEWLLYGKGSFPSIGAATDVNNATPAPFEQSKEKEVPAEAQSQNVQLTIAPLSKGDSKYPKSVSKVIICYADGTFEILREDLV